MATQITANLPTLNFPREADYPTQEDWAMFSAEAELNFGILGGDWSTQMQLWKTQANAMSIELNTNADLAQSIANYQGDWTSKGYSLGQSVSVSGVYYICKLTHATGQNPTDVSSLYWNLALGNWSLKVNNYGDESIAGIKTFTSSPIVPTPTANTQAANKAYADLKVALTDFTGANVNYNGAGYQKLPSGIIIQWFTAPLGAMAEADFLFSITFPTAVLIMSSTHNSSVSQSNPIRCYALNLGSVRIVNEGINSTFAMCIVIGY